MAFNGKHPAVLTVAALCALESLGLWAVTVVLIVDTVSQPANSMGGAIMLDAIAGLTAAATSVAVVAFWRGSGAVRGGIIVWQVMQAGVGIASAQGIEARWDIAVALIVPATVVTIFVLFRREVSRFLGKDA